MRIYEELFIVRPDATEEEIDAFTEQLKQVITAGGGTVDKMDKWGIRRLAYPVAKRGEGFYVLLQVTSTPDAIKELERRLRVSDLILKYMTVRIDEKLKRLEKRRKEREKRARRKPVPAAVSLPAAVPGRPPAPEQPVPEQPAPEHPEPEHPAPEPVATETTGEGE